MAISLPERRHDNTARGAVASGVSSLRAALRLLAGAHDPAGELFLVAAAAGGHAEDVEAVGHLVAVEIPPIPGDLGVARRARRPDLVHQPPGHGVDLDQD